MHTYRFLVLIRKEGSIGLKIIQVLNALKLHPSFVGLKTLAPKLSNKLI